MSSTDNTPNQLPKRCSKCGEKYPATTEFFRLRKSRNKLILCSQCIECERAQNAIYDRARRQRPEYLAKQTAYNKARCRTEEYKTARKARAQKPENKAKKKASRQTPQYKHYKRTYRQTKKHKAYMKAYQQTEEYKAYLRAWRERPDNKVKRRMLEQVRRTRKLTLPARYKDTDWNHALAYFNGCCAVCGRPAGLWHSLAADHWIPLADIEHCPGTIPTNIIPLCHGVDGCNNSKSDRDPVEWLTSRFGARKAKQILKRIEAYFASLKEGSG